MNVLDVLKGFVTDSNRRYSYLTKLGFYKGMQDDKYLSKRYKTCMGKALDLSNPTAYTEKLQWIKLNVRDPLYTRMVDKYLVREYVSDKIGSEHLIPLLGVWNNPDDIDPDTLPDKFVLKCNHNSGRGMYICKDKSDFDFNKAKKGLKRALLDDQYRSGREWPYKNVPRKVIAEKYMEDSSGELRDYKFFCFNGEVKMLFIATDRYKNEDTKFDFYDAEFNHLDIINGHPNAAQEIQKPNQFDEMKRLAEILSSDFPHVRVDLYEVDNKVYFGELTFFHHGGFVPFEPEEWDYKMGEWIDLSKFRKCEKG